MSRLATRVNGGARGRHPIAQEIGTLMAAQGLGDDSAAALVGMSSRTLAAFLVGKGTPQRQTITDLERLAGELRLRDVGANLKPAKLQRQNGLYRTRLLTDVLRYIDYAWKHRESQIYALTSIWGAGKTEAAHYWHRHVNKGADWYWEVSPGATKAELVSRIHASLKLEPCQTAWRRQDAIIDHLRKHPQILIFDQAEEMTIGALNTLQYIWDQTRVAVVLLAAPRLEARLRGGRSAQNLQRLRTRIFRAVLPAVSPAEVAGIVKDICPRPWAEGAFAQFYKLTGSGCLRQVIAGAHALNQVLSTKSHYRGPVTHDVLSTALQHLL